MGATQPLKEIIAYGQSTHRRADVLQGIAGRALSGYGWPDLARDALPQGASSIALNRLYG